MPTRKHANPSSPSSQKGGSQKGGSQKGGGGKRGGRERGERERRGGGEGKITLIMYTLNLNHLFCMSITS